MTCEEIRNELNNIRLYKIEKIKIGDLLYYPIKDSNNKRNIKDGIKDIACIFAKTMIRTSYSYKVKDDAETILLFSSSYRDREDHRKAFHKVQGLINKCVIFEAASYHMCFFGIKYIKLLIKWDKALSSVIKNWSERKAYLREIYQAYVDYEYIQNRISKLDTKIKNVITYCDVMPVDSFVTQMFNMRNITTITLQHGYFSLSQNSWPYSGSKSNIFLADSKASEDDAIEAGYKGKIVVVGSPHQINLVEKNKKKKMNDDVIGVVFDSDVLAGNHNQEMINIIQEYCKKNKKKAYIKLHPSNDINKYIKEINSDVLLKIYKNEISIEEFAEIIDVAIISKSTVFKTMIKLGIPVALYSKKGHSQFKNTEIIQFSDTKEFEDVLYRYKIEFTDILNELNDYYNCKDIEVLYTNFFKKLGID